MVIIVMNKKGLSPNRELEVEEEEEKEEIQSEYKFRRKNNWQLCVYFFVLESIPLSTFLPS